MSQENKMKIEGLSTGMEFAIQPGSSEDFKERMRALVGPTWHDELPDWWVPGTTIRIIGHVTAVEIIQPASDGKEQVKDAV